MSLSEFIHCHRQGIAARWETAVRAADYAGLPMLAVDGQAGRVLDALAQDCDEAGKKSGDLTTAAVLDILRSQFVSCDVLHLQTELLALKQAMRECWRDNAGDAASAGNPHWHVMHEAVDRALAASAAHCHKQSAHVHQAFLAMLAHDLRGPLSAISMAGQYLQATGLLGEKQLEAVGSIHRGSSIMKALLRDLAEYARAKSGGAQPGAKRPVNLAPLCEAAIAEVAAAYPDCDFRFEPVGDAFVAGDRERLHQLVGSLLRNAIEHGTRRLPVTVTLSRKTEERESGQEETGIALSVTNLGPAIAPDRLHAIFDPFARIALDAVDGNLPRHLGLGLFIAREVALAHGGAISAESSEETGTVLTVTLPAFTTKPVGADAAAKATPAPPAATTSRG